MSINRIKDVLRIMGIRSAADKNYQTEWDKSMVNKNNSKRTDVQSGMVLPLSLGEGLG